MKVTVVDYGLGNLHSVVKALRHEGADVFVKSNSTEIVAAERLVLPGVGAFGDGMHEISARGLLGPLRDYIATGRPLLGICLGMQLLLDESDEFGRHSGIGVIAGRVLAMTGGGVVKIPHVGWNQISPPHGISWRGTLLEDITPGTMVYFVHSFAATPHSAANVLAETIHGPLRFASAVQQGNVVGCQFHPEKSGPVGLHVLRRFLRQ